MPVEFKRFAGEGDAAQRWIDSNLPTCPLCQSASLWMSGEGLDQQALVRWYFQCSSCKAVLSTIPNQAVSALAEPVNVPKAALAIYLRVEGVQRDQDEDFVGQEFSLSELAEWADEASK